MKRVPIAAPLALLVLSGCGERDVKEQPYLRVEGEAKIEREAELFRAEMSVSERARERMDSLKAVSEKLDNIRDKLSRLKGLKKLTLTTSNARTETVRPTGCEREGSYRHYKDYPENCEPVDFISVIKVEIEGEPAQAAGSTLSLLTELGAESAKLTGYDVRDRKAAELEVRAMAMADATATAQALAERIDSRVGEPLQLRYETRDRRSYEVAHLARPPVETLEKGDPEFSPSILLDVPPDKVTFEAEVTAQFALKKPKAEK